MCTIVQATSKSQITLPAKWRKREEAGWETIFDAARDNDGKRIPIDDLIKALKKTL